MSKASRVKQCHSSEVIVLEVPLENDDWPEADALVTSIPNLPIGVITADCVPILLAYEEGKCVAAIHAGWQGALNGVIENTIEVMNDSPHLIKAMIGPAISECSYEVSKGFEKPFIEKNKEAASFFTEKNADKLLFDLKSYCVFRLGLCGVTDVDVNDIDTLTNLSYHSHRGGAGTTERNLSAIMING